MSLQCIGVFPPNRIFEPKKNATHRVWVAQWPVRGGLDAAST